MSDDQSSAKLPPTLNGKYFAGGHEGHGALLVEWTDDLTVLRLKSTPLGCDLDANARKKLLIHLLSLVLPSE